jgi:hypothetical protein
VPVPALLLTAEKIGTTTRIRIAPATQRLQTLIDATLTEDGALTVRMTSDGARVLPTIDGQTERPGMAAELEGVKSGGKPARPGVARES